MGGSVNMEKETKKLDEKKKLKIDYLKENIRANKNLLGDGDNIIETFYNKFFNHKADCGHVVGKFIRLKGKTYCFKCYHASINERKRGD